MGKRHDQFFEFLKVIPIVDTNQISSLFYSDCNSPGKRASEFLQELAKRGDIEGQRREMGKTKIWRLSSKKKKELGITKRSVPFNISIIDHILDVGNVYVELVKNGELEYFEYELREGFIGKNGKEKKYCPDGFFIYNDEPFFLELQRSPISSLKWKEKWKYGDDFLNNNHYLNYFDKLSHLPYFRLYMPKKPAILTISTQRKEIVLNGAENLKIELFKTINDFIYDRSLDAVLDQMKIS